MAARRGKSQAKRNGASGLPGWAWLVIGVLVTLLAVILVPRFLKHDGSNDFLRIGPKPNPDALPAAVNEDNAAIAPDVAPAATPAPAKPKPTQYDFYTLLPGEGVQMSDAELAASAKAEADAHARAQKLAAAAGATAANPASNTASNAASAALPTPVNDSASNKPETAKADTAKPDSAKPDTPKPAAKPDIAKSDTAPAATDAHYLLQAGAFGASGDAEAVKAKIAMLGLSARVESAQMGDKTVYRVRMGPYGSASELADAKAKLSGGGLPAIAVKTH
jgi:cell division protein FtsN